MILKIRLPVVKLDKSGGQRKRSVLFDMVGLSADVWMEHNSDVPLINHCKVIIGGESYKVEMGLDKLEQMLLEAGVKIIDAVKKKS